MHFINIKKVLTISFCCLVMLALQVGSTEEVVENNISTKVLNNNKVINKKSNSNSKNDNKNNNKSENSKNIEKDSNRLNNKKLITSDKKDDLTKKSINNSNELTKIKPNNKNNPGNSKNINNNNEENEKSNVNKKETSSDDFVKRLKKESMELIIFNLKLLEDMEPAINDVFGTDKYDKNINCNIATKERLLKITQNIRNVYKNIDNMTISDIKQQFNNIYEDLISELSGINWAYKHGFINSTKPYEVLIDFISYFGRLYLNTLMYKKGSYLRGYIFFN